VNWYFTIAGGHTHVRVFLNGGKCGDLCFRNEEFEQIQGKSTGINFLADGEHPVPETGPCAHDEVRWMPGTTRTGIKVGHCIACGEQIEMDLS
jgi:hypothetical protein